MRIAFLIALAACGSKSPAFEDAAGVTADTAITSDAVTDALAPSDAGVAMRAEHAVFSLVDNRHAAHRYTGGELVLDASDIGFARYTRFALAKQWHIGKISGGKRASLAERVAVLEVPLDAKLAKRMKRMIVRIHGRAKQYVAIRINGRRATDVAKTSRVDLVDGWQTVAFPIEPGRFGLGENQIAFETTGAPGRIGIEWVRLAADATMDDPRAAIAFDPAATTLALDKGSTLVWYLTVPEGAHLVAQRASCKVEVQAIAGDDSFAGGALEGADSRIDLTAMAGKVVGLTLANRDCARATVTAPEIRVRGPAPVALPKAEPPRYVILWVMAALRADKVSTFTSGARAKTPNLDELAKSSVIFRQFYAQGNEAQTSHASLWTGVYPAIHNVRPAGGVTKLDKQLPLLALQLRQAGYRTVAITGSAFLTEEAGYRTGFEEFRNMMREKEFASGVLTGDKVLSATIQQLDKRHRDQPMYLFFSTVDAHPPWIARKPWIDTYSPAYDGPFKDAAPAKDLGMRADGMGCAITPPAAEIERLRAIYDSTISYEDVLLGELVKRLKSWGIWDSTLLVVTSDHGEELFEDTRCGHGQAMRDANVRVPLLVHDPSRFPAGTVVDEGTEQIDVMATILDALGKPVPAATQGSSLAPLAQGIGRGWARPSYTSMFEVSHAMRIGRWKLRVGPTGIAFVHDMVTDADERVDLATTRLVERRMLTDNLGLLLSLRTQWKKGSWGVTTNVTKQGAAELDKAETP